MVYSNRIGGRCTKMSRKLGRQFCSVVDNAVRLDITYEFVRKLKRRQKKRMI